MSNKILISQKIKKKVIERDNNKCQKCGIRGLDEDLEIHHIKSRVKEGEEEIENLITLCSICHYYAPDSPEQFKIYISEKIDGTVLDTFRKSQRSISNRTRLGMQKKAKEGRFIAKAPKGYKLVSKHLLLDEEKAKEVREIFKEFLENDISLTKLAKKHSMTTSGIKKLLKNITYLGKIKFDNQILEGAHEPLIEAILFNKVQDKLEKISFKK